MPNADDLKRRAQAREMRKANREKAVETAHAEAQQQVAKQQENQTARKPQAIATNETPKPAPKRQSRTETVKAEKKAHEAEARKDASNLPSGVDVESELEKWDGLGAPPLHVLNAIASKIDTSIRDEGKEIATAAGKAAYETYVGKLGGKRNRYGRMRAQVAAGEVLQQQRQQQQNESAS